MLTPRHHGLPILPPKVPPWLSFFRANSSSLRGNRRRSSIEGGSWGTNEAWIITSSCSMLRPKNKESIEGLLSGTHEDIKEEPCQSHGSAWQGAKALNGPVKGHYTLQ